MKKFLISGIASSVLMASGCSLMPDYIKPSVPMTEAWSIAQADSGTVVAPDWWASFGSAELNALMDEALANNHDLKGAVARIEQSRASLKGIRGDLFPSVSATGNTAQNYDDGKNSNSWRAGVGIAYEVDLFGSVRSAVTAGEAELEATRYDYEAVKLVLMGDVAQTYFNLLNAKERLRIADDNLRIAGDILKMVQLRFDAGADSALEVAQQKSAYESSIASRATLEANVRTTETALAILLGKPPVTDLVNGQTLSSLQVPQIEAGVPSDLLERRPDIRQAEAGLRAANANIGVARAALYPSVTLGLDWTVGASAFGDPAKTALGLASSLAAPIFQGGRLEAGVEQATAVQTELVENYRQTVLTSFKEVEDALAVIKSAQIREAALASAQEQAQRSYDLSNSRYKAGTIDFQTLLDTQTQLFQAKDSYLQTKNERLAAAVTLYKALGGGWSSVNK